jgi:hypothetical protein
MNRTATWSENSVYPVPMLQRRQFFPPILRMCPIRQVRVGLQVTGRWVDDSWAFGSGSVRNLHLPLWCGFLGLLQRDP